MGTLRSPMDDDIVAKKFSKKMKKTWKISSLYNEKKDYFETQVEDLEDLFFDDNLLDLIGDKFESNKGKSFDVRPLVKKVLVKIFEQESFDDLEGTYEASSIKMVMKAIGFDPKKAGKNQKNLKVTRRFGSKIETDSEHQYAQMYKTKYSKRNGIEEKECTIRREDLSVSIIEHGDSWEALTQKERGFDSIEEAFFFMQEETRRWLRKGYAPHVGGRWIKDAWYLPFDNIKVAKKFAELMKKSWLIKSSYDEENEEFFFEKKQLQGCYMSYHLEEEIYGVIADEDGEPVDIRKILEKDLKRWIKKYRGRIKDDEFDSEALDIVFKALKMKSPVVKKKNSKSAVKQTKSKKKASKRSLQKPKKKTSAKTLKVRPSPAESATLFKVGKKKRGQDGNMYIIKENKAGVKRWVKA